MSELIKTHRGWQTPEEAAADIGIKNYYARFGVWVVTDYGLECLYIYYDISAEQLKQAFWPSHMAAKNWVDIRDFNQAFMYARQFHNREAA